MMTVTITCNDCGSAINVYPDSCAKKVSCDVCESVMDVHFNNEHEEGILKDCPVCQRKDFYQQKDFNRKIGVGLFIVGAIFVPWTYGISLIALWLVDFFLFRRLGNVACCYKCNTLFRGIKNMKQIYPFNHEMNDRIVYADHDFGGQPLEDH